MKYNAINIWIGIAVYGVLFTMGVLKPRLGNVQGADLYIRIFECFFLVIPLAWYCYEIYIYKQTFHFIAAFCMACMLGLHIAVAVNDDECFKNLLIPECTVITGIIFLLGYLGCYKPTWLENTWGPPITTFNTGFVNETQDTEPVTQIVKPIVDVEPDNEINDAINEDDIHLNDISDEVSDENEHIAHATIITPQVFTSAFEVIT